MAGGKKIESQRVFVSKVKQKEEIMKEKESWVKRAFIQQDIAVSVGEDCRIH